MSKRYALFAALIGMIAGAYAGSPYLERTTCDAMGAKQFGCELNTEIAPFISAIAVGGLVALVAFHLCGVLAMRLLGARVIQSRFYGR